MTGQLKIPCTGTAELVSPLIELADNRWTREHIPRVDFPGGKDINNIGSHSLRTPSRIRQPQSSSHRQVDRQVASRVLALERQQPSKRINELTNDRTEEPLPKATHRCQPPSSPPRPVLRSKKKEIKDKKRPTNVDEHVVRTRQVML